MWRLSSGYCVKTRTDADGQAAHAVTHRAMPQCRDANGRSMRVCFEHAADGSKTPTKTAPLSDRLVVLTSRLVGSTLVLVAEHLLT